MAGRYGLRFSGCILVYVPISFGWSLCVSFFGLFSFTVRLAFRPSGCSLWLVVVRVVYRAVSFRLVVKCFVCWDVVI